MAARLMGSSNSQSLPQHRSRKSKVWPGQNVRLLCLCLAGIFSFSLAAFSLLRHVPGLANNASDLGELGLPHIDAKSKQEYFRFKNRKRNGSIEDICNRARYPQTWELRADQVTILINGFSLERIHLLQQNMRVYSSSSLVHSVFLLWGNTSTPLSVLDDIEFESFGAPIYIVKQGSTSLNARFLPRPYIKTRAVLICDDDITIELHHLKFALQVWMENQGRIVGFFPRCHLFQLGSKSWVYTKRSDRYSIMLTKLMILSTEFLYLYTCKMPKGVKEYVDEGMNCEDIAMNFLVSNYSGLGPLLVEGQAWDWGDTRSSGIGLSKMALSARAGHRKNRGECLSEFQKLWGGLQLRYSYYKASMAVEEEVLCQKFGLALPCDTIALSRRDAWRISHRNIVTSSSRFAYVTFVHSRDSFSHSLVLIQSLRNTSTIHDFVVLLHPSCTEVNMTLLEEHFDVVKQVKPLKKQIAWTSKLNMWLLTEYRKLIYIDTRSLVLANMDPLFNLSEFAAVPHIFAPDKFSTELMVLEPSNITYTRMKEQLKKFKTAQMVTEREFFNAFFDSWFSMPEQYRLPARYNVLAFLVHNPWGFDPMNFYNWLKPFVVVRYEGLVRNNDSAEQVNSFDALKSNDYYFLANLVASIGLEASQNQNFHWPLDTNWDFMDLTETASTHEALVTVLWNHHVECLAAWLRSYKQHHTLDCSYKTLLLVSSTLSETIWKPFQSYFDNVIVINATPDSFSLLHLWEQTHYRKLVYVDICSIFMDNCNALFDYSPFAAIPNIILPDTFSTRAMVIQPNLKSFDTLKIRLQGYNRTKGDVEQFLNDYYKNWYLMSSTHRIKTSLSADARFQRIHGKMLTQHAKILSFSSVPPMWSSPTSWMSEAAITTSFWRSTVSTMGLLNSTT